MSFNIPNDANEYVKKTKMGKYLGKYPVQNYIMDFDSELSKSQMLDTKLYDSNPEKFNANIQAIKHDTNDVLINKWRSMGYQELKNVLAVAEKKQDIIKEFQGKIENEFDYKGVIETLTNFKSSDKSELATKATEEIKNDIGFALEFSRRLVKNPIMENVSVNAFYKKVFGFMGANIDEIKFGQNASSTLRDALKKDTVNEIINDVFIFGFSIGLKQTKDVLQNILLEKKNELGNAIENKAQNQVSSRAIRENRPLQMKRSVAVENSRTMAI